jgi:hypothetical protein
VPDRRRDERDVRQRPALHRRQQRAGLDQVQPQGGNEVRLEPAERPQRIGEQGAAAGAELDQLHRIGGRQRLPGRRAR